MPTKITNRKRLFAQPKMLTTKVEITENEMTIKLPADVLAHLHIAENNEVHWTVIGGVIQISGEQPQLAIPVLSGNSVGFEAQP